MTPSKNNFKPWVKQKTHPDCQIIQCAPFDPIKDFEMEPTGHYVLIRVNVEQGMIEVAVCNEKHEITHVFQGESSQSLYHNLLKFENENGLSWFKSKEHLAYLGKELKKCELALLNQERYVQE